MRQLTPKQKRFVREFLVDQNGAQAAIRAGYSPKCARETAYRLLTYDHVQRELAREQLHLAERVGLQCEDAIRELMTAAEQGKARGDPGQVIGAWREIALLLGFYPWTQRRVSRLSSNWGA